MPYIFIDDGYPEAADFEDNYRWVGRVRSATPPRPSVAPAAHIRHESETRDSAPPLAGPYRLRICQG